MIEQLAAYIPRGLWDANGRVFYSGREAFRQVGSVYIRGANPGGSPDAHLGQTVGAHTEFVLGSAPNEWSAYLDESWLNRRAGDAPLQRRLTHLVEGHLGLNLRRVPSSNLVHARSQNVGALATDWVELADLCWPFHAAIIKELRPKAIIGLGVDSGRQVLHRIGGGEVVARFREQNARRWESIAWRTSNGMLVFGLTHPGRVDWTNPAADPGPMVRTAIDSFGPNGR